MGVRVCVYACLVDFFILSQLLLASLIRLDHRCVYKMAPKSRQNGFTSGFMCVSHHPPQVPLLSPVPVCPSPDTASSVCITPFPCFFSGSLFCFCLFFRGFSSSLLSLCLWCWCWSDLVVVCLSLILKRKGKTGRKKVCLLLFHFPIYVHREISGNNRYSFVFRCVCVTELPYV